MRDFPLLLFELRLLQRKPFRAHTLEIRVVALVQQGVAVLDVHYLPDDAVQKVPIMRDQQQRTLILAQPSLQPNDRIQVEVIGRFVEQQ